MINPLTKRMAEVHGKVMAATFILQRPSASMSDALAFALGATEPKKSMNFGESHAYFRSELTRAKELLEKSSTVPADFPKPSSFQSGMIGDVCGDLLSVSTMLGKFDGKEGTATVSTDVAVDLGTLIADILTMEVSWDGLRRMLLKQILRSLELMGTNPPDDIDIVKPEEVIKEAFWLAWQSSTPQENRPDATKEEVWKQVITLTKDRAYSRDYIFGRMVYLELEIQGMAIGFSKDEPNSWKQSWARTYPTYSALLSAAAHNIMKATEQNKR